MNLLANILAARGEDGNPELWFYLVLAIVFIGKSVISYLKTKREDNEEEPDLETEDHHEKRVREVIAEMRRTVPERPQQAPRQEVPQPRVAARAPRPAPSPVELPNPSVKRKQRPQPDPVPDWGHGHAQKAARNTMERYVKAEEGAHESIRSLSDAEQAALQRLQQREKERQPESIPSSSLPGPRPLKDSLRHSQSLRTAILYQEILGKPKALQGFRQ